MPLRIAQRGERHLDLDEAKAKRQELWDGDANVELDRLFLRDAGPHALIFGEPGSGKTTALYKLHQLCLEHGPEALGLQPGTLPVFLRLRRLGPDLPSLPELIRSELDEIAGGRLDPALGEELWRRGRLLLLFDGLDEIADESRRTAVCRHLEWQLGEPGAADVRAVISCRYAGWTPRVRLSDDFLRLDVRPFDDEQIATLVELWFREASRVLEHFSAAEAGAAAERLLLALESPEYSNQQIKVLVSTPLLLTLLCVVVLRGGQIPRQRVGFYEECLRVLLGRWRQQAEREPPVDAGRATALLGELAWYLHVAHRRDTLTAVQGLVLLKRGLGNDRALAFKVFEWLYRDAGLIERYTEKHYGFVHLGLQEYLTAQHLAENEELLDQVCGDYDHAEGSWWREVLLLLVAMPGRRTFAPLVRRLLATDAPLRRADLLADCLREASHVELTPFLDVLRGEDDERRLAVLRLLRGHCEEELLAVAESLATEGPEALQATARQLVDTCRIDEEIRDQDVFLLHHPADRSAADRLAKILEQRAIKVHRPRAGHAWHELGELGPVAERCEAVAVLVGSEPLDWEEIELFWELCGEDVDRLVLRLPGDPRPGLPDTLAGVRMVDLRRFDAEEEIAQLMSAIAPTVEPEPSVMPVAADQALTSGKDHGEILREPITEEIFLPVPAGRFQMGGTVRDAEQPLHWVRLSAFWLARTPVTNRQYALFLKATDHREPAYWRDRRFSEPEQPVVGVSWDDAIAYAGWLAKVSGLAVTLPTEAQWEYAARGTDGREYPWGTEKPSDRLACFGHDLEKGRTAVVGSYSEATGPFGHLDQAGNVWEWCLDVWNGNYVKWVDTEPVDPVGTGDSDLHPLRGGAWWHEARSLRSATRLGPLAGARSENIGFRVSVAPASLNS